MVVLKEVNGNNKKLRKSFNVFPRTRQIYGVHGDEIKDSHDNREKSSTSA